MDIVQNSQPTCLSEQESWQGDLNGSGDQLQLSTGRVFMSKEISNNVMPDTQKDFLFPSQCLTIPISVKGVMGMMTQENILDKFALFYGCFKTLVAGMCSDYTML